MPDTDIDYKSYLKLDTLLSAQHPVSGENGDFAHDEMMFIVVHQAYELWFKLVLFELDRVQELLSVDVVKDSDMRTIASALSRINEILRLLVKQLDIIETMKPLDFLDFRHVFRTASGFQSLQFRELEIRLGLKREDRVEYDGKNYDSYLSESDRAIVQKLEHEHSLFEQLDTWLARTPFVDMGGYNFWNAYKGAVDDMLAADREKINANTTLPDDVKQAELTKIDNTEKQFDFLFRAPEEHTEEEKAFWHLSWKGLQAALFISLYRDQPVLHVPHTILSQLMDMDELLTLWRYRHALMAQRMLGMKMGSGGSSGHDYLAHTARAHRVFGDLFKLSTFMIPRSELPELPEDVAQSMGFRYGDVAE